MTERRTPTSDGLFVATQPPAPRVDQKRPHLDLCKCSLRGRLVGDGCQYCNPELAAEFERENDQCK